MPLTGPVEYPRGRLSWSGWLRWKAGDEEVQRQSQVKGIHGEEKPGGAVNDENTAHHLKMNAFLGALPIGILNFADGVLLVVWETEIDGALRMEFYSSWRRHRERDAVIAHPPSLLLHASPVITYELFQAARVIYHRDDNSYVTICSKFQSYIICIGCAFLETRSSHLSQHKQQYTGKRGSYDGLHGQAAQLEYHLGIIYFINS